MKAVKLLPLMLAFSLSFPSIGLGAAVAAEATPAKTQRQTTVTVLHVDKFGVYGPGIVFYWDAAMSKEKIASITSSANRLRNKKATITYLAGEEGEKDKRPLIVGIEAVSDDPRLAERETSDESDARVARLGQEKATQPPVEKPREQPHEDTSPRKEPQEMNLPLKPAPPVPQTPPPRPAVKQEPEPGRYGQEQGDKNLQASTGASSRTGMETSSTSISKEEITQLIRVMLALNEKKDVDAILPHYGDQVDYYGRGLVDREHIRKDMGYYFRNWDRISTFLEGDVVLIVTDEKDTRIVKFISNFSVENSKKSITGKTENIWKIVRTGRGLRIIDVKQKILSSETGV